MLRNILIAIGGAMFITGVLGALAGHYAMGFFCLVWGAILVFGIVYERYAYKNLVETAPTGKHWTQTQERFIDDKSGRLVVVYYNSLTGERAYVALPGA